MSASTDNSTTATAIDVVAADPRGALDRLEHLDRQLAELAHDDGPARLPLLSESAELALSLGRPGDALARLWPLRAFATMVGRADLAADVLLRMVEPLVRTGAIECGLDAARRAHLEHRLLGDTSARTMAELRLARAVALAALGRDAEALPLLDEVRRCFDRHGDEVDLARGDLVLADICARRESLTPALEVLDHARSVFAAAGRWVTLREVDLARCRVLVGLGAHDEALVALDLARSATEWLGAPLLPADDEADDEADDDGAASSAGPVGPAAAGPVDASPDLARMACALDLAESEVCWAMDDVARCRAVTERLLAHAWRRGDEPMAADCLVNLAHLDDRTGDQRGAGEKQALARDLYVAHDLFADAAGCQRVIDHLGGGDGGEVD